MKQIIICLGITLSSICSMGQARDGTLSLNQREVAQPAALINLPYAPDIVQQALNDYLSKTSDKHHTEADSFLLSRNTLLVKNNLSNADMYFEIGARDKSHLNESVVYLKLNSFSRDLNNQETNDPVRFDMQQAKDYLDNLAVAIRPYASELQLRLQKRNLSMAQAKSEGLARHGKNLEDKRIALRHRKDDNRSYKNDQQLNRKIRANEQAIKDNLLAQALQTKEVVKQQFAIVKLMTDNQD
jgi:hypothetical protein